MEGAARICPGPTGEPLSHMIHQPMLYGLHAPDPIQLFIGNTGPGNGSHMIKPRLFDQHLHKDIYCQRSEIVRDRVNTGMFTPALPPRMIPWSAIVIALLLTMDFGYEIYQNYHHETQIEQTIEDVQKAAAVEKHMQQNQQRSGGENTPVIKTVEDAHSIELEALGVKLKMVREATWQGVFKICFLWAFVLGSLAMYRKLIR